MTATAAHDWTDRTLAAGRYRVTGRLAGGSRRYAAIDVRLNAAVEVRRIDAAHLPRDARLADLRGLTAVRHPHLLSLLDLGEEDGATFAVVSPADGTLAERHPADELDELRPLTPAELSGWLPDVAAALDAMHRRGRIHGRIDLAAIVFDCDGNAFLDPLASVLSAPRDAYRAPEILVGQPDTARADQYSLGVVAYEALCGRLPYRGATPTALAVAQSASPPPELHDLVPAVSEILSRAIGKALAVRPEDRFPTCSAFATAVVEGARTVRRTDRGRSGVDQRCPVCNTILALELLLAGRSVLCESCQTLLHVAPDLARLTAIVGPRGSRAAGEPRNGKFACAAPTRGGSASPALRPGGEEVNSIGQRMVVVPAGEFEMGSPATHTAADDDERPWHRVEITRAFLIGAFPVTQAHYERVMGVNPSAFSANGRQRQRVEGIDTAAFPVERVSWLDAVEFCNRLSRLEGFPPYYAFESPHWRLSETRVTIAGGGGYRLPTEAEWEGACRAGTSTVWFFGDDEAQLGDYAWYGLANGRTQAVGGKRPNPLGLFDVYGNVWEWCHDWHAADTYAVPERRDPQGPASGTRRVLRGGAFFYNAASVRSGYRFRYPPTFRLLSVGFRVARTIE